MMAIRKIHVEGANHKIQGPFLQEKMRYAYEKDAVYASYISRTSGRGIGYHQYGYRDRVIADGGSVAIFVLL